MPIKTRSSKLSFSNILLYRNSRKFSRTPLWDKYFKIEKTGLMFSIFSPNDCRRPTLCFSDFKLSTRWSKPSRPTIDARSRKRLNPWPIKSVSGKANEYRWRPRRYQGGPRSRGQELEGGVLRYPPKPDKNDLLIFETDGEVLLSVWCKPAA